VPFHRVAAVSSVKSRPRGLAARPAPAPAPVDVPRGERRFTPGSRWTHLSLFAGTTTIDAILHESKDAPERAA